MDKRNLCRDKLYSGAPCPTSSFSHGYCINHLPSKLINIPHGSLTQAQIDAIVNPRKTIPPVRKQDSSMDDLRKNGYESKRAVSPRRTASPVRQLPPPIKRTSSPVRQVSQGQASTRRTSSPPVPQRRTSSPVRQAPPRSRSPVKVPPKPRVPQRPASFYSRATGNTNAVASDQSATLQSRSRSPVPQGRNQSPVPQGRNQSPVSQGRSQSPVSQGRTQSPVSQGRFREKDTECCICYDPVSHTNVSRCGHGVCQKCVGELNNLQCPTCRKELEGPMITNDLQDKIYFKNEEKKRNDVILGDLEQKARGEGRSSTDIYNNFSHNGEASRLLQSGLTPDETYDRLFAPLEEEVRAPIAPIEEQLLPGYDGRFDGGGYGGGYGGGGDGFGYEDFGRFRDLPQQEIKYGDSDAAQQVSTAIDNGSTYEDLVVIFPTSILNHVFEKNPELIERLYK